MAYQFQISANILSWPRACACCTRTADTHIRATASRTTGKRVQHTITSWWDVPYCSACIAHKTKFDSAGNWLTAGLIGGVAVWVILGFASSSGTVGFVCGLFLFLASLWAYHSTKKAAFGMMRHECSTPSCAVRYIEWHGTFHTFIFCNQSYLDAFLAANSRKTRSDVRRV